LSSLVEKYPLYSNADEALYLLGQNYEAEITRVRSDPNMKNEAAKGRMIEEFTKGAADAYAKILTRYPIMDRSDDAKKRLAALHQPVPRPTKAAVAQNRAEDASRRESGTLTRLMSVVRKNPDVAQATKVGDPTLVDPTPMSATQVVQEATRAAMGTSGEKGISVERVDGSATPPPNDPAPRSDSPSANGTGLSQPGPVADPNELKPGTAPTVNPPAQAAVADPNELKPNTPDPQNTGDQALPPPPQVNELQQGQSSSSASADTSSAQATDEEISSSKKKKKKGLKKIVPF
jgi:outer membrane protein assembly factor BamD